MFEYDTDKMDTVMSNMKNVENSLSDNFDNINGIMNSISDDWEGEASSAFLNEVKKGTNVYPSYVDTIEDCIQYMKESNSSKVDVEKKNESLISKIFKF